MFVDDKETTFMHPDQIRMDLRNVDLTTYLKKGRILKKEVK